MPHGRILSAPNRQPKTPNCQQVQPLDYQVQGIIRVRTPDEIDAIRTLHAAGVNMTQIAQRFDCSRSTVMRIVRGMTFQAE